MGAVFNSEAAPVRRVPEHVTVDYSLSKRDQFWAMDKRFRVPVMVAESGVASRPPVTIPEVFAAAVKKCANRPALAVERDPETGLTVVGKETSGEWIFWTWQEYYDSSMKAGKALMAIGLKERGTIVLSGFNSPEFNIAFMGCILAGGIASGVYPTNTSEANLYIMQHSEASIIFVENQAQLDKFLEILGDCPLVKAIVVWTTDWDYVKSCEKVRDIKADVALMEWNEFMDYGVDDYDAGIKQRIGDQVAGDVFGLIYTSGTTGNPKAVMINHDNVTWAGYSTCTTARDSSPSLGNLDREYRFLSYLPNAHIAAILSDLVIPIVYSAYFPGWVKLHFARPDALKGSLGRCLQDCRPAFFLGVPRVWEKIMEAMKAKVAADPPTGFKKSLIGWAKNLGERAELGRQIDADGGVPANYWLAKRLIFSKVRQALGLECCEYALTGAAPISMETLMFFGRVGIHINETFGMSETCGLGAQNHNLTYKTSSVGWPLPGSELKIDHVEGRDEEGEGEICIRGRQVMTGYMCNPNLGKEHVSEIKAKNEESIDDLGWLHSGDIGRVDKYGMYYITGRLKELIITAGGENIAPVPIEQNLKEIMPALSNVMLIGDKRKYNVVLITLKCEIDMQTMISTNNLTAEALGVAEGVTTVTGAVVSSVWADYISAGLEKYNETKAGSRPKRVQKFKILDTDFSVSGGELTATMKLKRSATAKKFQKCIDEMYGN